MEYLTVDGTAKAEYEIQHSVFIAQIKGVENFEDGLSFVKSVSKDYSDATHNCYAVNCLDGQKFSDDGEPQGTAGQPIMQAIKKNELANVALVVTRYFGGIKLGAGGLVTSYTKASVDAITKATIVTVKESAVGKINVEYGLYRKVADIVEKFGKVTKTDFDEAAVINYAVPVDKEQDFCLAIAEATAGRNIPEKSGTNYVKY